MAGTKSWIVASAQREMCPGKGTKCINSMLIFLFTYYLSIYVNMFVVPCVRNFRIVECHPKPLFSALAMVTIIWLNGSSSVMPLDQAQTTFSGPDTLPTGRGLPR